MARERSLRVAALGALARGGDALPDRVKVRLSGRPPIVLDGQRLDAGAQLLLATRDRLGAPAPHSLSVEAGRAFTREEAAIAQGRTVPVRDVRELRVPGATGPLAARFYGGDEPSGPHPLLVFFHGGGFVVGDLDTHDAPCRFLCRHAGVNVLSVAYGLAPEHPFPEYVDDALASWTWAADHAADLGADPRRIGVAGDSAGGNLAAVVAQAAARGDVPAAALQLLVYPATDATRRRRSHELFGEGFFLTSALIDWYAGHHLPEGSDPTDVRRSPLLAADLAGVAPAVVVTAGFDPLRDEGEAYAQAMTDAGVPVVLRRFPALFHGFFNSVGINAASRAAVLEIAGMTRALLRAAPAPAAGADDAAVLAAT